MSVRRGSTIIAGGVDPNKYIKNDASNLTTEGKSVLSGLGFASSRYTDVTLGASEATYTAPANGWFSLITQGLTYLDIHKTGTNNFGVIANPSSGFARQFVPVSRDEVISIYYTGTPASTVFRFYYAEGDE